MFDSISGGVSPGGRLFVSVMVAVAFWSLPGSGPRKLPLSQSVSLAALPGCPPSIELGPKGKRWLYVFYRWLSNGPQANADSNDGMHRPKVRSANCGYPYLRARTNQRPHSGILHLWIAVARYTLDWLAAFCLLDCSLGLLDCFMAVLGFESAVVVACCSVALECSARR